MKDYKKFKDFLISILVGLGIGIFLESFFSYSVSNYYSAGVPEFLQKFENQNTGVLIERLIYMGIGAISYFSSYLFVGDKHLKFINNFIHFFLIQSVIFLAGLYLYWFPRTLRAIIVFFGASIIIYVVIYIIICLSYKYSVDQINKKLKDKK